MADKKKDKVKVRDLKPNKDAKGGIGRYANAKAAQGTKLQSSSKLQSSASASH